MKKLIFSIIILVCVFTLCIGALASETVYVSSSGDDSSSGTVNEPLKSLYAAFRALPYGGTVVVCDEIVLESTEFPKSNGLITVTSVDGSVDYRSTNGGSAKLTLKGNLYLKSAVCFENLDFYINTANATFVCNGYYTCLGNGLTMTTASATFKYPGITLGSSGAIAANGGYLEIHSGTYHRLRCAASNVNSAAHTGDTTAVIYGGRFNDVVYLCGEADVNGNTNVYIYGGEFPYAIVGASSKTVTGNIYVSVYGGSFSSYLRPATNGRINGNCTLNILGGNIAQIYDVSNGSINGKVTVNVAEGIALAQCPFETVTLSSEKVAAVTAADTASIKSASAAKCPTDAENPLTLRDTSYTGTAQKVTVFAKKAAGGDLNGDSMISLIDALRSLKYAASGNYDFCADINEDGVISIYDTLAILRGAIDSEALITEYTINNVISDSLSLYGGASATDNTVNAGYVFGTVTEDTYSIYSDVSLDDGAVIGMYWGCNDDTPTPESGYYFEANTARETLTVYKIVGGDYRVVAENKLNLLSDKAQIKVTYGASTMANAVQLYFNDNPLVTEPFFDFDLALDSYGSGVGLYVENATATLPVVVTESVPTYETYTNFILSSLTDPEIYYENGTYYIYGTKSGGLSGVLGYTTTDFVTFTELGTVLAVTDGFGDKSITAANIVKQGDIYYMFYLQPSNSLGYSTTGYATSTVPQGPFTDSEKVPLTSETDLIGGQPFIDDDGTAYLVYTRTTGGNKTYISRLLLADGKAELDLSTETMLLAPSDSWEYAKASVVECGFIIKHEGIYYLIYAGGNYNSTYGVGYATSENIYGPYVKYEHNPIMWSNDQAFGNGAASVFPSPDGNEHFIIYLRNTSPTTTRPLNTCIDRIRFVPDTNGGADILEIQGATVTPQPLPSGIGTTSEIDYQYSRWHW